MTEFVAFQNYATTTEAEVHAEILREAGIPAILQGPQSGIFGAGFAGWSVQGITLLVPAGELELAAELIGEDAEE